MSGREEEEEEMRTHMMRLCTRSFLKNEEERHRGREREREREGERRTHRRRKTKAKDVCMYIGTSSPTFHRDLPIIIFFSHHL
jgi:hypothetical protein